MHLFLLSSANVSVHGAQQKDAPTKDDDLKYARS
jgi:hypothetical protein